MTRKVISAVCLLALAAAYGVALAGPLLAGQSPDCCAGTLCPMHPQRQPAPPKPDCHQPGDAGLADCAMSSCQPHQHHAVSSPPYLLPEPPLTAFGGPRAAEIASIALFFPAPPLDVESPPPRTDLA